MKKIIIVISIFLFFASLFISCESIIKQEKVYNPIEATEALATLAPAFSEVIRDNPEFVSIIKEEANKKFDGDTNVLFEKVANLSVTKDGKTLKDLLTSKLVNKGKSESVDELISKIPYFNIYVFTPEEKSPNKNIDENIIVCANRYDVDDQDPNYIITGHDTTGNLYAFEKGEEPDRTTFVLGVNEALAYQEFLEKYGNLDTSETPNILTTTKGGWDGLTTHEYYLDQIYLYADCELFPNGPAEVYCLYVSSKNGNEYGKRINLDNIDYDKTIYENQNIYIDSLVNEINQGVFAIYFREWDVFFFWDSGTLPDQVVAKVTIDTVNPPYTVDKVLGCNRWDDDLCFPWAMSVDNGHVYYMPECVEVGAQTYTRNGFKIRFWDPSYIKYYFNGTSDPILSNWVKIKYITK